MNKTSMKDAILEAKENKGLKWGDIAEVAQLAPEYVCSACLGMNHLDKRQAAAVCKLLDLDDAVATALQRYPLKTWSQIVPTDPAIYRLYEIMGVYGEAIKEVINEQFGDGIMSAIDFSMNIERQADPKGDRVVITMNGKFLPYKSW